MMFPCATLSLVHLALWMVVGATWLTVAARDSSKSAQIASVLEDMGRVDTAKFEKFDSAAAVHVTMPATMSLRNTSVTVRHCVTVTEHNIRTQPVDTQKYENCVRKQAGRRIGGKLDRVATCLEIQKNSL